LKKMYAEGEQDIFLVKINKRIYRKTKTVYSEMNPKNTEFYEECNEETCDALTQDPKTQEYILKMEVPKAYHKFISGKRGATKLRIEQETFTTILLPKVDSDSDIIGKPRLVLSLTQKLEPRKKETVIALKRGWKLL
jgi:hypothetical protein